jgi:potassium-transporting ATPase KdpC subunit
MKTYFLPAIKIAFLTMILFGVIYPLFIVGMAKLIGPGNGNGETIEVNGMTVGFELIGQSFTDDKYFNSRPSAVNYNAAATGGSNKGPSNPDYLKQVEERINDFLVKNPGIKKEEVPVDLITASGGGLDPDISEDAALVQIQRIAKVRRIAPDEVKKLVDQHTDHPIFGLFGISTVHVLALNIALDKIK